MYKKAQRTTTKKQKKKASTVTKYGIASAIILVSDVMSYLSKTSMGFLEQDIAPCLFMVLWVIGLIPHGGMIELFLIPASAPQMV